MGTLFLSWLKGSGSSSLVYIIIVVEARLCSPAQAACVSWQLCLSAAHTRRSKECAGPEDVMLELNNRVDMRDNTM